MEIVMIEGKSGPTIQDFREKYGVAAFGLLVREYMERAPDFESKEQLEKAINNALYELECALEKLP